MQAEKISKESIFEAISMNRQSGNTYTLKMKNNPSVYIGIPVISEEDSRKYSLSILEPKEAIGVFEGYIDDIEFLEKH